ncbi:hypothetical protein KP509_19G067200 [Ceratopteris richardii]|uniref:Uncharacterized protein n=1 Tax=Ceratopteris richardii TaxID=49495 RepID=A0A8T2SPU3_CERRI|nr:hypothetical protein KP509_19G067200 [Ceratopteris richardii]
MRVPTFSDRSISPILLHSKALSRFDSMRCTLLRPKASPGHARLADPKGRSSKSCPRTSIFESNNLSGQKRSGSFQTFESLPIAHTFMQATVERGMLYPQILQLSDTVCGMNRGAMGCSLIVSLIIALKYGRRTISDS